MNILMGFIYGVLFAFWRRWFGGGFAAPAHKWLENRALQAAVFLLLLVPLFVFNWSAWQNWLIALVLAIYLYAQFWSRGHGACFDLGRTTADADLIKRYNDRWYHVPVDGLFNRLLRAPDKKYGFLYDFIYMSLRYVCPIIPLGLINPYYLLIGMLITPIYAFMWTLSEKDNWLFAKLPASAQTATKAAEYLAGFVFGSGMWIMTRGW